MISCIFEDGNRASLRHVVVHAILEKDGKLLLGKRAENLLEGGKWALPGGFMARDETAEEAVLRELKEETGWSGEIVKLLRVNSNPKRPKEDRQNIALDFTIKPLQKISEPDQEFTEIKWVPIESLDLEDLAFDHGESIKFYLEDKKLSS